MLITNEFVAMQLSSPHLRAIVDYWVLTKADRPAPTLSDIDPTQIPAAALPFVILADLESRPFRIRYRLVGTHGASVFGSYVGRYLDELAMPEGVERQLTNDYALAAWACMPVAGRYHWPTKAGSDTSAEYVIMPLLHNGAVTRFFSGEHVGQHQSLYPGDLVPMRRKAPGAAP